MKKEWTLRKTDTGRWQVINRQGDVEITCFEREARFYAWLYNVCAAFQLRLHRSERTDTSRMRVDFAISMILTRNPAIFNQRAFDDCFEMGDGDAVVTSIMTKATRDNRLKLALQELGLYENWKKLLPEQLALI